MADEKPLTPQPAPNPLTKQDFGNILSMIDSVNIPFNQLEPALALKVKLIQHYNSFPEPENAAPGGD